VGAARAGVSRTGRCEPHGQVWAARAGKTNLKETEKRLKKSVNQK